MTTTRVLAGLVSNGNILADGTITPEEIGILSISGVTYPGDDQAANPAGGQTITITGVGFVSTPTVYVGGVIAPSVSFISSTQITFTSPAKTAGTYDIYVVNPSGSTAIRVYGISYSGTPTWTTPAGELGPVDANFTIQLVAAGDAPMTYALTSGSTLPSGVTLSSAGLITGSALTVEQTFNFSVDAIDGQAQETPRSFAVTVSLADPYFKYVSMLLSGDPLVTPFSADASTNNFNLSINGNARSNNFTPYQGNGYYSNSFGTSNYLSFPNNAALSFGTGDFCVEAWVYKTSAANESLIDSRVSAGASPWAIYVDGSNFPYFYEGTLYTSTVAITLNAWNHIAVTRSSGTLRVFVNGVQGYSSTVTTNLDRSGGNQVIGANVTGGANYWSGYISNLRIVKGSAVYTSAFTPSTTPLTAITNTSLLTCQSNRFIDNSTNAFAITVSGNTAIAPAQPFTLPSSVATYGSGYFDGAGDTLTTSANTAFAFGTGDFTIEFWAYKTADTSGSYDIAFGTGEAGTGNNGYFIELSATRGFVFAANNAPVLSYSMNPNTSAWNHYAVTRSGSTLRLFVGGAVVASTTYSTSIPSTTAVRIGGTGNDFFGYLADVRVVKGTAVYTTTYTLPTAPLTAISGTSLLTAQYNGGGNNSGFKDSSQNNFVISRNGNTTQGTFTPYGSNWSAYFNGSSNLAIAGTPIPTSGAFSFEAWIFVATINTAGWLYTQRQSVSSGRFGIALTPGTTGCIIDVSNGSNPSTTTTANAISYNTWTHVAVTRDGSNNLRIFINGVLNVTTASYTYSIEQSQGRIGFLGNSATQYYVGYISNMRITNTALYTATFTPSTAPLTAVSGTTLLTCQSNRFVDNSTNAYAVTTAGTPSVQRFSPFAPSAAYAASTVGGSVYFDGSADYLSVANNTVFDVSGGQEFTVEFWWYPESLAPTYQEIVNKGNGLQIYTNTSTLNVALSSNNSGTYFVNAALGTLAIKTWNHVALVRSGNIYYGFLNGVRTTLVTTTASMVTGTDPLLIGIFTGGQYPTNGYVSDVRFIRGTAVYTSAFTPPTSPLTLTANTQFLLSNTNSGVYDSAMINDLETAGNAQVSTSVKKYGTGSMYFDGTGDGLFARSTPDTAFGTSDFTVEFWLNLSANLGSFVKIVQMGTSGNCFTIETQSSTNVLTVTNLTSTVYLTSSSALTTGSWIHVAVTRASGTLRIFQNGTQTGSVSNTVDFQNVGGIYIGQSNTGQAMNGYIDDLRITDGVARYTANFTPPTAPFKGK